MPPSPAFSSLRPTQRCCWCAYSALKLRQLGHSPTARLALLEVKPTNNASATLRHPFQSMLFGRLRAASNYCLRACPLMMSILGEIDSMRLLDVYSVYTTAYATLAGITTFRRAEELSHQHSTKFGCRIRNYFLTSATFVDGDKESLMTGPLKKDVRIDDSDIWKKNRHTQLRRVC